MAITDLQLQYATFHAWLMSSGGTNAEDRERMKKALRLALDTVPTEKQKKYILDYFIEGLTLLQIADKYGVNKSTVSRTIHAGMEKINKYMQFATPNPGSYPGIKKDIRNM